MDRDPDPGEYENHAAEVFERDARALHERGTADEERGDRQRLEGDEQPSAPVAGRQLPPAPHE